MSGYSCSLGSGRVSGGALARALVRFAAAVAAAVVVVVVGSSSVWAAAPEFLTADETRTVMGATVKGPEAAAVTLLVVGDDQIEVGPPVRARDTDARTRLTYKLSDTDADSGHSDLFWINSGSITGQVPGTGQISRWSDTPAGVYKVTVSASDDGFDADDSDTASVAVVIHVTSAGLYPRWSQAASVTASDGTANDWFGVSVDASGGVFVVGAPFGDSSTVTGTGDGAGPGAAYVFNASSGAQLARLDSPNAANGGWFGFQVQVVGDVVFVSAPKEAIGTVSEAGRVYVYTKPAGGWADTSTAAATLTPGATSVPNDANNGLGGARFGDGLAVSDDGSTLAVGAPYWQRVGDTGTSKADITGMDKDGAVFVFAKPETGWANASTDTSGVVRLFGGSRLSQGARLGERVAVSDNGAVIAVAAPFMESSEGRVFVFTKPDGGWASTILTDTPARLEAIGRIPQERMGSLGLDISGDGSTVVAGAPVAWLKDNTVLDTSVPAESYGRVVVFTRPDGGWSDLNSQNATLSAFGHKYDGFGSAVAVSDSGNKIAVGNPWSRSSNYRGSVYVYTKPETGWADDTDGVGDNVQVLTAAITGESVTDMRQRYGFGGRGLAFAGEDSLVVGQSARVPALVEKDGLSSLPTGGLYSANADHSSRANVAQGSAYVFDLAQAPPVFLQADLPLAAAAVRLLAVGDNQTLAGPPVRAHYYGDRSQLTYMLSDSGNNHSASFTIDSATGQISRRPSARVGVYQVRVSVSDSTAAATVDVTIHVTSSGEYPREDTWLRSVVLDYNDQETDMGIDNQFGYRVAASSEVIVVSAIFGDVSSRTDSGAVYVFDASSGAQLAKLEPNSPDWQGYFGSSVAVKGDTIVVGARWEDRYDGRVYVFTKPDGGWADSNTAAVLTPRPTYSRSLFGSSVSLSGDGNTLVVGMPELYAGNGRAFVFTKPAGGWVDTNAETTGVVMLTAGSRMEYNAEFGRKVAISDDGNTIAVSAPAKDTVTDAMGFGNQGAVYVFAKPDGGWANTGASDVVPELSVGGQFPLQSLGRWVLSLSDDGSTLVTTSSYYEYYKTGGRVGQILEELIPDDEYGSAFVYVRPAEGWADATQTAKLGSFGHKWDQFGTSAAVSSSGDKIAVGNPYSRSSNYRGSVYVYTKPEAGWADDTDGAGGNLRVLTAADADTNMRHRYAFGYSVAFSGEDRLAVGQTYLVWPLLQNDGRPPRHKGGLYGANESQFGTRLPGSRYLVNQFINLVIQTAAEGTRPSGSAHLFNLLKAVPQPPASAPQPPASVPPTGDGGTAVPDGDGPAGPPEFADVDEDSVHAESIKKVAALGITVGTTATTFSPSEPVTRAQMATFVARTWEATGRECPSSGALSFDDVAADSTHAAGIDCVSALGVTRGTAERTFSPSAPTARAQMATFLARAWEAAGRECPSSGALSFDDVAADSTHADSIGCIAALRITRGTAAGTFSPSDTVTRAQMATFLVRFYEALTDTA